ncbi:MAG: Smr/MutS family protein, partial [Gemmatimonadaceae bacterium]
LTAAQEKASRRGEQVAERERLVTAREREVERQARSEARRYLLDARQEVERTIRSLKDAGAASIEETAAEARRAVEQRAGREKDALAALDERERAAEVAARAGTRGGAGASAREDDVETLDQRGVAIEVGDAVAVGTLGGKTGQFVERRGDEGVVTVGAMRLTVPLGTLRRISARHLREERQVVAVAMGDIPDVEAKTEVDVRGMRVHEVDEAVLYALDAVVRADLKLLRIIHGKGTGALRERVNQLLARDSRAKSFRLGAWNEGGAGVTIVELA